MVKRLEQMKECLVSCVQNQISGHLDQVDTKELGEAIDMIKDLEEAIYYCTITKAMNGKEKEDYPRHQEPRYYGGDNGNTGISHATNSRGSSSYYSDMKNNYNKMNSTHHDMMMDSRDRREGTSPMYRRMYMESKEMNQDTSKTMQDLEKYMQELSGDVMEMIANATPEEKQMLRQKITTLATKIK